MSGALEKARTARVEDEGTADPARAEAENSPPPGGRDAGDEDSEGASDPLARPVETWSVDDLKAAMLSETYRNAWDPAYEDVHQLVDRWHELFASDGRPRRAAQGKTDPVRPLLAHQVRDRIRVRAHVRVGVIPVRAHDRARRK